MGEGSEELGKVLIKAFFFALTQQDELPGTIIFYNGGVKLSNAETLLRAGANVLVAGSAVFGKETRKNTEAFMELLSK